MGEVYAGDTVHTVHRPEQGLPFVTVKSGKGLITSGGHPQQMDVHYAIPPTEEDDEV